MKKREFEDKIVERENLFFEKFGNEGVVCLTDYRIGKSLLFVDEELWRLDEEILARWKIKIARDKPFAIIPLKICVPKTSHIKQFLRPFSTFAYFF